MVNDHHETENGALNEGGHDFPKLFQEEKQIAKHASLGVAQRQTRKPYAIDGMKRKQQHLLFSSVKYHSSRELSLAAVLWLLSYLNSCHALHFFISATALLWLVSVFKPI